MLANAWRRFYSIRSMIKRLGMPKSRGDLVLWIANLAVNGALTYRCRKDYWKWKDRESGLLTQPLATASQRVVKVQEDNRLVKAVPGPSRQARSLEWGNGSES